MKRKNTQTEQKKGPSSAVVIRGLLMLKGDSLQAWSERNGYVFTTVRLAVGNFRHGPLSREIRRKLAEEVGL
jgi:hypothetical protein